MAARGMERRFIGWLLEVGMRRRWPPGGPASASAGGLGGDGVGGALGAGRLGFEAGGLCGGGALLGACRGLRGLTLGVGGDVLALGARVGGVLGYGAVVLGGGLAAGRRGLRLEPEPLLLGLRLVGFELRLGLLETGVGGLARGLAPGVHLRLLQPALARQL